VDETVRAAESAYGMVGLEDGLKKDDAGRLRDEILSQLGEAARDLKLSLDKGVPLDDYKRLREVGLALESAQRVVEIFWTRHHPA